MFPLVVFPVELEKHYNALRSTAIMCGVKLLFRAKHLGFGGCGKLSSADIFVLSNSSIKKTSFNPQNTHLRYTTPSPFIQYTTLFLPWTGTHSLFLVFALYLPPSVENWILKTTTLIAKILQASSG